LTFFPRLSYFSLLCWAQEGGKHQAQIVACFSILAAQGLELIFCLQP
jgi:hypothetical protein